MYRCRIYISDPNQTFGITVLCVRNYTLITSYVTLCSWYPARYCTHIVYCLKMATSAQTYRSEHKIRK